MPRILAFFPAASRNSLAVAFSTVFCFCLVPIPSVHGATMRITALDPAPSSILTTPPSQIILTFSNDLDTATVHSGSVRLQRSGGDGSFSEGNEHYINPVSVTATGPKAVTLDLTGLELPDDTYRVVVTQDMAGHWALDESSGFLAHDSSGNGNDGVAIGDWTSGKINGALHFNGSSSKVKIHDAPALRVAGDLTVALWIKKTGPWPDGFATLFNKGTGGTGNYALYTESEFQHLVFQQYGQDTRNAFSLNSVASIQADQWYHIACVRQGEEARLYVDGTLDGTATVRTDPNPTDDPLAIGYSHLNPNVATFEGEIDDVRIYARALSAGEIAGILTKEPGVADATGQLIDGEFSGTFPSGNGVAGGDFLATFEIRRPRLHATSATLSDGAVLAQAPATIRVEMDQDVDPAALDTTTARILSPGDDGIFETADDLQIVPVPVQIPAGEDNVVELNLSGATLPEGPYQVRLSGNASGSALTFFERRHWVALPDSLVTGLSVVTVECWFRTTRPGDLLYAVKSNGANEESLLYVHSDGHLQAKLGEDSAYGLMYSSQRVDDGRWHHVALVGNVDVQRLYVDGEWQGTLNVALNLTAQTVNTIGGRDGAGIGNRRFIGDVDEFRVWNAERTEQQIRADMNLSLAGNEAGLLAYYRFDEGTGTAISDATANGNDATVNGASPVWTAYGAPISGGLTSLGGEAMDGEFRGVYPSGDGWPGGDFALNFEIRPDLMTVVDALPVPGSVLGASPDGLTFDLSRAVDPASLPGNVELVGRGNDDLLDTVDDVVVSLPAAATPTAEQVTVDLTGTLLVDDVYRVRLASNASRALSFSGEQLVTLPDDLLQGYDYLTISLWFKTVTPGLILGTQESVYPALGGNQTTILAIGDDGRLYGELWVDGGSYPSHSEQSLVDGRWHHVALVAGRLDQALYVDGDLVDRRREGGFDLLNMSHLQLGAGVGEGYPGGINQWQFFSGQLDELRIWTYERSGEQIKRDMHRSLTGSESGLLAYYRMDEASGDALTDDTVANDGLLGGGLGAALKPERTASSARVAAGVRAADGGFLDGEFTGTFPSGDGVAGGNFDAVFALNVSYALPVADDVQISTLEDHALTGNFSASDDDGDALTYEILDQGDLGHAYVLGLPAGRFLYIPKRDANGQDQFTYRVFDGTGYSAPAHVIVNIIPVNDRPVALDFSAITSDNRGVSIDLIAYDPDGDALTFEVVDPPQHGEMRGLFPDFDYVPVAAFQGTEDITYRVFDGKAYSSVAHIIVVVDDALATPVVEQIYPGELRGLPGVPVTMQLYYSDPLGPDPVTNYAWAFGDGESESGVDTWQVSHAYANTGTYMASVRLEFASGYFVVRTASVCIAEGQPSANLTADDGNLNLQSGKFKIAWKKDAAGVPSDSLSVKGYLNPLGGQTDLSGASMELIVNGVSLGTVDLASNGKGTFESGGATLKAGLKAKNGAFSFAVSKADLRSVIPLANATETGNEELALAVIVFGAGLVNDTYACRAVFAYATKQDSKSTGKFSLKKNTFMDGMFFVAKAAATQGKGSNNFSLALSGWFAPPGGGILIPNGDVELTLGGTTLTLAENTLTASGTGFSVQAGSHPDLVSFVMDSSKRSFVVKTNLLAGTLIPLAGDLEVVHELPVKVIVPTSDGLVVFESSVQIRRSSSTALKWKH